MSDASFNMWDEFNQYIASDTPMEEYIRFNLIFKRNLTREQIRNWLIILETILSDSPRTNEIYHYLTEINNSIHYLNTISLAEQFPAFAEAAGMKTPEHRPTQTLEPLAPLRPPRPTHDFVTSPIISCHRQLTFETTVSTLSTPPPIRRFGNTPVETTPSFVQSFTNE